MRSELVVSTQLPHITTVAIADMPGIFHMACRETRHRCAVILTDGMRKPCAACALSVQIVRPNTTYARVRARSTPNRLNHAGIRGAIHSIPSWPTSSIWMRGLPTSLVEPSGNCEEQTIKA